MKKVIKIIVMAAALTLAGGCFVSFEGPGGWNLDDDSRDANFDFNHIMSEPKPQ